MVLAARSTSSCVIRPLGPDPIKLAPTGKVTTKVQSFKVWYMFWGIMALGDTSTAQMIQETGFKTVRVEVKMGVDDFLIVPLLEQHTLVAPRPGRRQRPIREMWRKRGRAAIRREGVLLGGVAATRHRKLRELHP